MGHAREAGATGYLAKPIDTETLKAYMEYAIIAEANRDTPSFTAWLVQRLSVVGA